MRAIVSTVRFILLVDFDQGNVFPIERHRGEYYGISWFPGTSDLVLSHSGVENDAFVDLATYACSEKGFLSRGAETTPTFLSLPHQILCTADGGVITTNTGRNRLQIVRFDQPGRIHEMGLSDARWDRLGKDGPFGDHLNSVFRIENRLYVLAHGHNSGSTLVTCSYPNLEIVAKKPIKAITGLHNIFISQSGQEITCHSHGGCLFDSASDCILWESGTASYLRGLAATEDILLIGDSAVTNREGRATSDSGIWVINRRTWKTMDYVYLGPYGGVHEVRLIDVPDEAHHGHPLVGYENYPSATLASALRAQRLRQANAALHASPNWKSFRLVFGFASSTRDGWRQASDGDLNLAVLNDPHRDNLTFRYQLEQQNEMSHVSAVVGYQGGGGDDCMNALLMAYSGSGVWLTLWKNRIGAWEQDRTFAPIEVKSRGLLWLKRNGDQIGLSVEGSQSNVHLPASSGYLGIRWIGSSVLPVT